MKEDPSMNLLKDIPERTCPNRQQCAMIFARRRSTKTQQQPRYEMAVADEEALLRSLHMRGACF